MMYLKFLDNAKKKKIVEMLEKEYGIKKLPYLLVESGSGKYWIYSGALSKEEIKKIGDEIIIETIGTKLCTIDKDDIRLSFDALNIPEIKKQITKGVYEMPEEKIKEWLKGENIETEINADEEYLIIKNQDDFLGAAKNRKTFLHNYIPKERRVKN